MNAIEIKNISKKYKDFSIENFTLNVPKGCIMGLIGENGAGKSTLIKMILGIIKKGGGEINVIGKDNEDNFKLTKQDIGFVLDDVGIPYCVTAKQTDKIMKSVYTNWNSKIFFELLQKLSVPENKKFADLSRGMKMKLGIAIALSHKAKLLILDEATNGLDPVVRDEVSDLLIEFTRDEENTVLISSHIVSDLEKICDYIAFIHNGRLLICEEKDTLLDEYCIVQCSKDDLSKDVFKKAVGRKSSKYGTEMLMKRKYVPSGYNTIKISIEELFLFMVKQSA